MADIVFAYAVMAYVVMAYIVMASATFVPNIREPRLVAVLAEGAGAGRQHRLQLSRRVGVAESGRSADLFLAAFRRAG